MTYRTLIASNQPELRDGLAAVLGGRQQGFEVALANDLPAVLERLEEVSFDALLIDCLLLPANAPCPLAAAGVRDPAMTVIVLEDAPDGAPGAARDDGATLPKAVCAQPLAARLVRDLIEKTQLSRQLLGERRWAQVVLDAIADGVVTTDRDGRIRYLNAAAEKLSGWRQQDALGRAATDVLALSWGPNRQPLCPHPIVSVLASGQATRVPPKTMLTRLDGSTVPIADSTSPLFTEQGRLDGAVVVFHDVTAEYEAAEKLAYLAQHDTLTGLPNRLLLVDRLQQAMAHAERHRTQFALLFIDLDRFKHVNDSLGHAVGDQLLASVARRLKESVRAADTVSRLGGDEFAVLLSDGIGEEAVERICHKIEAALAAPHRLSGHVLRIRCSIGAAFFPAAGRDVEQLLHSADQSMYQAKRRGYAGRAHH